MKQRHLPIDLLRAFSIVGVMVIHTLSFSLASAVTIFIWNFLQFVVAVFIFCSGFVHGHYSSKLTSVALISAWYKKRCIRILAPFYIYFAIHYLLFLLFPNIFTHFGLQKNLWYILGSIFLYGGINTNWLPILFLELTLLTPLFFFLQKERLLWLYILAASIITAIGTIWFFPYNLYKILIWIGWSLVFLLGLFSQEFADKIKKVFLLVGMCGLGVFAILFFIWPAVHHAINFTDNKYPPNWYYLSYATALTCLAYVVSQKYIAFIPQRMYEYISKHSYSLFFIHYIVLDVVLTLFKNPTPFILITEIIGVIIGSLTIQSIISALTSPKKRAYN